MGCMGRLCFILLLLAELSIAETIEVTSPQNTNEGLGAEVIIRSLLLSDGYDVPLKSTDGKNRKIQVLAKRRGYQLDLAVVLQDATGKELERIEKSGSAGDVSKLSTEVLAEMSKIQGKQHIAPNLSLGDLLPYTEGLKSAQNGDFQGAARAMALAKPSDGMKIKFAQDFSKVLSANDSVPSEQRIAALLQSDDAKWAQELGQELHQSNPKDPVGIAAKAHALILQNKFSEAKAILDKAGNSDAISLVKAHWHRKNGDDKSAARELLKGIQNKHQPSIAAALDLDSNGQKIVSKELIRLAQDETIDKSLRRQIAYQQIQSGDTSATNLAQIDASLLATQQRKELREKIAKKVKDRDKEAMYLEATLLAADGSPEAERALENARLFHKDPRFAELDNAIAANNTAAVYIKNTQSVAVKKKKQVTGLAQEIKLTLLGDNGPIGPPYLLGRRKLNHIQVVAMGKKESSLYMPYSTYPDRLEQAITTALSATPRVATVTKSKAEISNDPGKAIADMDQLHSANPTDLFILYQLRNDGLTPRVFLYAYAPGARLADQTAPFHSIPFITPEDRDKLVAHNPLFWGFLILLALAMVGYFIYAMIRGSGSLTVNLELDPTAKQEAVIVFLSKKPDRPHIPDREAFAKKLHAKGIKKSSKKVELASARTKFKRVPAGNWYVHVYGVYQKNLEWQVLQGDCSSSVSISKNEHHNVELNLVPTSAEVRLQVYAKGGPAPGVIVQAKSGKQGEMQTYETGNDGFVKILAEIGSLFLTINEDDFSVKKEIVLEDASVKTITVNIEREREREKARAELEDGIDFGSDQWDEKSNPNIPSYSERTTKQQQTYDSPLQVSAPELADLAGLKVTGKEQTIASGLNESGVSIGGLAMGAPAVSSSQSMSSSRYDKRNELGRGAMGVVYEAFDPVLERNVAVKEITDEIKKYPQLVNAFKQEAKTLASLNHPNIVTVFDQGQESDTLFLVMELIDGKSLDLMLEKQRVLPLSEVIEIASQLCKGLAFAHKKRVIHRDIKPANVFLTSDGIAKLGDFGLARVLNELQIKQTTVKGTPLYMPPEQILGTDIDFRADIYSMGCTIFEMLTGEPPFVDGDVLYHHMHSKPPSLSSRVANLPPVLDDILGTCLAKSPNERFSTADALSAALKSSAA